MLPVVIMFCSWSGLALATFIHFKKKQQKPLVCPIGHSCDPVVHSDYSRFMKMPVEVLGILYYLIVLLSYLAFTMNLALRPAWSGPLLLCISSLAFIFSAYLTAVQAFVLKEWCTWCLISAFLCTVILLSSLQLSGVDVMGFIGLGASY